jgi:isocitrate lyase
MSNPRAVRYRRLALQETDAEKAKLLQSIADEAERGVLCTAEWLQPKVKVQSPAASSPA